MNEETRNIPPIVAYARQMPDRVAYRMLPSGATVTWRELEQRSRRCARAAGGGPAHGRRGRGLPGKPSALL
ncbi:hypothetical protein WJ968_08480 [Achromobacter xylosoxidans]